MTPEAHQQAAELLWSHWQDRRRLNALPEACRPYSRRDAYAIQAHVAARAAQPDYGWKIAATSEAGQAHIGVDGPLAGRLLGDRAHRHGATIPVRGNAMRVAEAEFAFVMARDLPSRERPYVPAEVMGAVARLHPAIEIPDSRFEDFASVGAAQLIADNACADWFILGDPAPDDWRDIDLVHHVVMGSVGQSLRRAGSGENVLGDPVVALTWLANEVSRLGLTLKAGQVVTTGTCLTPLPVAPGDTVTVDFGVLGTVRAHFRD